MESTFCQTWKHFYLNSFQKLIKIFGYALEYGPSSGASHPYRRALLSVENIPTKYGVSHARGGGVITIRIQKFKKYYHETSSTYSSSGCDLYIGVSSFGWSLCISTLKCLRLKGAELFKYLFSMKIVSFLLLCFSCSMRLWFIFHIIRQ